MGFVLEFTGGYFVGGKLSVEWRAYANAGKVLVADLWPPDAAVPSHSWFVHSYSAHTARVVLASTLSNHFKVLVDENDLP